MSNLKNVLAFSVGDIWFGYVYEFVFHGLQRNIFWRFMYLRGR